MSNSNPDASLSVQEAGSQPQSQPAQRTLSQSQSTLEEKQRCSLPIFATLLVLLNLVILACCIVVVYLAHSRPVAAWIPKAPSVQPAVLISLLVAIFGLAQKTIFAAGLTIVWWRAQRDHRTTLADLHHIWNRGTGSSISETLRALQSSSHVRLVLLVFLAMTIIDLIDGPLLQRSITTVMSTHVQFYPPDEDWRLPAMLKDGDLGMVDNEAPAHIFGSGTLDNVLRAWYMNQSSRYDFECRDTCSGPLRGAGIVANCSSSQQALDFTDPSNVNAALFSVELNRTVDSAGAAILEMEHRFLEEPDKKCNATLSISRCTIKTGTVVYDVLWSGFDVQLNRSQYPRVESIQASPGDLPSENGKPAGALAALEYFGYYYVESNASLTKPTFDGTWGIETYGSMVQRFIKEVPTPQNESCWLGWNNGTDDLLWNFHDVMFRLAWRYPPGDEPLNNVTWTNSYDILTYKAEFRILWLVASIMTVGILVVVSTFWGFWELCRKFSLSPVETGRALAETLSSSPTGEMDMEIEVLLKVVGQKKAQ